MFTALPRVLSDEENEPVIVKINTIAAGEENVDARPLFFKKG